LQLYPTLQPTRQPTPYPTFEPTPLPTVSDFSTIEWKVLNLPSKKLTPAENSFLSSAVSDIQAYIPTNRVSNWQSVTASNRSAYTTTI
jgi:hypothetical protein